MDTLTPQELFEPSSEDFLQKGCKMASSAVIVLKQFFGFKHNPDGEIQTLPDFKREVDCLTSEEKEDLATQAAKAMGLSQADCTFTFTP